MSNKAKDINIKNRTYYFFNAITNIEYYDPNNTKRGEKYRIGDDRKISKNL